MAKNISKNHITCFDHFSLTSSGPKHHDDGHPFDPLCKIDHPADAHRSPAVFFLPGVDVLDLFSDSVPSQVWKDGQICQCLTPRAVVGWEFHSLLWPQPGSTSPLTLCPGVELLGARPPRGKIAPSLLFAYVSANYLHAGASVTQPAPKARDRAQAGPAKPQHGFPPDACFARESLSGNLDTASRTISARILVLSPSTVYREPSQLPKEQNWGLFIGPRSRSLVLLNKQSGRVDLHLAMLLAVDSVYRLCEGLIEAIARLFTPFGSENHVAALFGTDLDPLLLHSGLTNSSVVDHVSISRDGREDYQRYLGISLPSFFLSNASNNLCFLTPGEAQELRSKIPKNAPPIQLPEQSPLPDMPRWTLHGHGADETVLTRYRLHVPTIPRNREDSVGSTILSHILGFQDVFASAGGGKSKNWLSSLTPDCTEVETSGDNRNGHVQSHHVGNVLPQGDDHGLGGLIPSHQESRFAEEDARASAPAVRFADAHRPTVAHTHDGSHGAIQHKNDLLAHPSEINGYAHQGWNASAGWQDARPPGQHQYVPYQTGGLMHQQVSHHYEDHSSSAYNVGSYNGSATVGEH